MSIPLSSKTSWIFFNLRRKNCEKPFVRPWVKLVNFDFSAKSSSTDYNESNKPTSKSLAHIGSEKSLVELEVQKN